MPSAASLFCFALEYRDFIVRCASILFLGIKYPVAPEHMGKLSSVLDLCTISLTITPEIPSLLSISLEYIGLFIVLPWIMAITWTSLLTYYSQIRSGDRRNRQLYTEKQPERELDPHYIIKMARHSF